MSIAAAREVNAKLGKDIKSRNCRCTRLEPNLNTHDHGSSKPLGLIVIGLGSIGGKHLRALGAMAESVITFDQKPSVGNSLNDLEFKASFFSDEVEFLREVQERCASFRYLAFIASWADSHLYWLERITALGISDVYCEKPLTNSLSDSWQMIEHVNSQTINFYVGYFRRLTKYSLAIQNTISEVREIAVTGGAGCLITNGSHWIDLAVNLFGEPPDHVITSAEPYKNSPRNANIETWVGSTSIVFPLGRRLTMSFSNNGSRKAETVFSGDKGSLAMDASGEWIFKESEEDGGTGKVGGQKHSRHPIDGSPFDLTAYPELVWADFAGEVGGQTAILRPSLETELTIQLSVLAQLISAEAGGKPISLRALTRTFASNQNLVWNVT